MAFNRFETDVENIQKLDDRPQITAAQLKACFDQAGVDIKTAVNGLMTQLEALTSAGNIGANALGDEYVATTIQGILAELKAVCDLLKNADNITANSGEGWPTETLTARLNRIKTTIDNLIIGQLPVDSISNSQLGLDIKVGSLASLNTTEKSNVVGALNEILSLVNTLSNDKADNKKTWTTTLDTTWTGATAPYTKTISLTDMIDTYVPVLDIIYSSNIETAKSETEEFAKISKIESGAGTVTLTCFEEKPTISLNVRIEVMF